MIVPIHSGNWEKGRRGHKIEGIVIHIMQGTLQGTDSHFKKAGTFVSSHCGIGKNGMIHEYVDSFNMAYHAGRNNKPTWSRIKKNIWGGIVNANRYTYGIECEGYRGDRWTEPQMQQLTARVEDILNGSGLPYTRDRIISHNEIAIDKEDMSLWCDEIIRRLNWIPNEPPDDKVGRAVNLLKDALRLLQ